MTDINKEIAENLDFLDKYGLDKNIQRLIEKYLRHAYSVGILDDHKHNGSQLNSECISKEASE